MVQLHVYFGGTLSCSVPCEKAVPVREKGVVSRRWGQRWLETSHELWSEKPPERPRRRPLQSEHEQRHGHRREPVRPHGARKHGGTLGKDPQGQKVLENLQALKTDSPTDN